MLNHLTLYAIFKTAHRLVREVEISRLKEEVERFPPKSRAFVIYCCNLHRRLRKKGCRCSRDELMNGGFWCQYRAYKYVVDVKSTKSGIRVVETYDF